MGDGSPTYMTAEDIRRDIEEGVADAVKRAKVEALTDEEKERLFAIVIMEGNTAGVSRGMEVVSTSDSGCFKLNYQAHIPFDRSTAALINERVLGLDLWISAISTTVSDGEADSARRGKGHGTGAEPGCDSGIVWRHAGSGAVYETGRSCG